MSRLNKKQREWLEHNLYSIHQTAYDLERSFDSILYDKLDDDIKDDIYDSIQGLLEELWQRYEYLDYLGDEYD